MLRILLVTALLSLAATASADETPRTISVSGTGSASTAPDRARLNMSIMVRNPSLDAAQDEAAKVTQKVLAMTDALAIDRKRVDTTGASVSPDYRYDRERGEQELRGYIATRNIAVVVMDLDKLAPLVEGAVDAGVNQITPPQLFSSKRRAAYRKALDAAAKDARANAEQLAESLGLELGSAISVNASPYAAPPTQYRASAALAMEAADAAATYNPGDQDIRATINVVFEIDD